MERKISLDILMNSTFDKDAGGRETWLYNFLPELLKDPRIRTVKLFGFKTPGETNHIEGLELLDSNKEKKSLYPVIFERIKGKLPKAYYMYKSLKAYKDSHQNPDYAMAMGIFEMMMLYKVPRFKKSVKIVFLRSIFSHEKAYAIPKLLRTAILRYEIRLLKKADIVLGNGDDIRDFYKTYGVNVRVIKNGVNMTKWESPLPNLTAPLHIAYVGRLSQVKGIEDYLKLIEKVKSGKRGDQFIFHLVGDNGSYRDQVAQLESMDFVVNHHSIANDLLPKFLQKIDVCVALTYASSTGGGGGTSNAMMEQMAAARIMLAWDNRIFRQYLNDRNSYLAEQFSVEGLEKQLYSILDNKDLALDKAIEGKRTIDPFSYKENVANFKRVIGLENGQEV